MSKVLIVAATMHDKAYFERSTYLGLALKRLLGDSALQASVACQNQLGVSTIFNAHILERLREYIVIFTHDDVYIDDYWLGVRLEEALQAFHVVGVAGNIRRLPRQSAWCFKSDNPTFEWDRDHLSGAVCHIGKEGGGVLSSYGPSRLQCQMLDGMFLATRVSTLLDRNIRFDEQFPFHFYDLDFCRTAVNAGLTLGTWPIAVSHASEGAFGAPEWQRCRDLYFKKWGD